MNELDSTAQRWLELARGGHDPTPDDARRVRALLHARCIAAPGLLAPTAAKLAGSGKLAGTLKLASAGKLFTANALTAFGVGVGAGLVLSLAAVSLSSVPEAPSPAPSASAARAVSVPSAQAQARTLPANPEPPPAESNEETPAPVQSRPRSSGQASAPSAPERNTRVDIRAEIAGLRQAQQLLHRGRATDAVAALAELDEKVPRGELMEERAATRTLALCSLGSRSEQALAAFFERYPNSMHGSRVVAACRPSGNSAAKGETETRGKSH